METSTVTVIGSTECSHNIIQEARTLMRHIRYRYMWERRRGVHTHQRVISNSQHTKKCNDFRWRPCDTYHHTTTTDFDKLQDASPAPGMLLRVAGCSRCKRPSSTRPSSCPSHTHGPSHPDLHSCRPPYMEQGSYRARVRDNNFTSGGRGPLHGRRSRGEGMIMHSTV